MEGIDGRKIGLPLSGGNVDASVYSQVPQEAGKGTDNE